MPLIKQSAKSVIYIALYRDNISMIGSPKRIDAAVEQLKKNGLALKVMESLWDYLSCKIQFSEGEKKACLGQPFLIKSLEKKFDQEVMKGQSPMMPINYAEIFFVEDKKIFQSRIGMLLYLVKHSRPDLANTTQLFQVMYSENQAAFLEML